LLVRLAMEVEDKKLPNAITGYAVKQVGNDLRYVYFGSWRPRLGFFNLLWTLIWVGL
jgi:hypothetical protein